MRKRLIFVGILATLALSLTSKSRPGGQQVSQLQSGPRSTVKRLAMSSRNSRQRATFAAFRSQTVLQAARDYPPLQIATAPRSPLSLTASDGTGLILMSLKAKAVMMGPLAFTELHLAFRNPQNRVREGRFEITLPPGAAVSRFAMKLASGWQEAEMVERHRARQIYEDFLHRKQDPALLEKKAGNQFRARVFPIPAGGIKEIKISYSQNLASAKVPYRLYLKGLPKIAELDILALTDRPTSTRAAGRWGARTLSRQVTRVQKAHFKPTRDFELKPQVGIQGLAAGELAVVRVTPPIPHTRAPMKSLVVLMDTSASRAAGFTRQVKTVNALIQRLAEVYGKTVPLKVACFDQGVLEVYSGPMGRFGTRQTDRLLAHRPLGASNLHEALAWAKRVGARGRLLLVTDGIATAGETDGAKLKAALKVTGPHVSRADVLLLGGIRDETVARLLIQGTLAADGVLLDDALTIDQMTQRLSRKTVSGIKVAVTGAKWIWPAQLSGVQPGESRLIFAQFQEHGAARARKVSISLTGPVTHRQDTHLAAVKRPLLQRAWVQARIASLTQLKESDTTHPDLAAAMQKQIVALSLKHRVLSDYTAMLVLETAADYQRYGIGRNALSGILVVGATGVEVMQRGAPVLQVAARRPPVTRTKDSAERTGTDPGAPTASAPSAAPAPPPNSPSGATADRAPSGQPSYAESMAKKSPRRGTGTYHSAYAPPPRSPRPRTGCGCQMGLSAGAQALTSLTLIRGAVYSPKGPPALTGKLLEVMLLIQDGRVERALLKALAWRTKHPGDVLALIALGESLQAAGNPSLAARAYGSIIDLFPSRADLRRYAGARLEALGKYGLSLAIDCYQKAVKQRPDHASGHRALAMALARAGRYAEALSALEIGLKQRYRINRSGVLRIMKEDLGLIGAAQIKQFPSHRNAVTGRLHRLGARLPSGPSVRFVLSWETDANDVDFHVLDSRGGHASYRNKTLPSGGSLYADVTNGYGPECFTINGHPEAYPYRLLIHYYSRGPMGYGMGRVQVVQHDGRGGLRFQDRPFVAMNDKAYVYLGELKGSF